MGACEELHSGVVITYRVIIPMLVALGMMGSIAGILVLNRPQLKRAVGNQYFLALSVCDLFLSLSYIIIAITACGCTFDNYASAWFFTHFGWSITCSLHAVGTYIIVFMSLDRFVAVWFPSRYTSMTKPPFDITNRLIFAVVLCFGLHVVYMVDGEVEEVKDNCTTPTDLSNTSTTYISTDGFQNSFDKTWHEVYRYIYNVLVRWLPCVLMIIFNVALVLAVITGRVKFPRSKEKVEMIDKEGNKQEKKSKKEAVFVITTMAMTASFLVMTMPITIFLTAFAGANDERCKESSRAETLRHVGNVAQLLEHVLHGIYLLLLNPNFKQELLCLLKCQASSEHRSANDESDHAIKRNSVFSCSSKSHRHSTARPQSQPSRSSRTASVAGKASKDSNPLCGAASGDTSKKFQSRSSDTSTVIEGESTPLCSDTGGKSQSLCNETSEDVMENSQSLSSKLEKTSERSLSPCSDTEAESSAESASLCNDTAVELQDDSDMRTPDTSDSVRAFQLQQADEINGSLTAVQHSPTGCSETYVQNLDE